MASPLNNVPPLSPEQEPLIVKLQELVATMEESKDTDAARWAKADEERQTVATQLQVLEDERQTKLRDSATAKATEAMLELQASLRAPSKAGAIGQGNFLHVEKRADGEFIGSIVAIGDRAHRGDFTGSAEAKAKLESIGGGYEEAWGKATLGTTDATGGWIIPNAIVDDLIKPAIYEDPYAALCNDVPGVTAFAVDIPFRSAVPGRAVVAPFGSTKENVDLAYNGYTATMYTIARIHDLSAQFVRQSQGAAERDVMQELATAFAKGTAYYTLSGTGSGEPYGLLTAITNSPATFTSSFTANNTNLANSVLKAIATAGSVLGGRDRDRNLSAVVNPTDLWLMVSQGTDDSGFFFAGMNGAAAIPGVANGTLVTPFGVPVVSDSQLTAHKMIVGQFKALKRYFGQTYRVDTSSEAGTRWDANVIGFRGEMEFGLDARPAVYAGAFQYIAGAGS